MRKLILFLNEKVLLPIRQFANATPNFTKGLLFVVCFIATTTSAFGQDRYWVAGGDGNWNSINNWSASSNGASGASVPNTNAFRVYFDSFSGNPNVQVNLVSFSLQQLLIAGNQTVTFTSSGGARTITIGDAVNNSISGASVTNADFVVESGSTLNITGATVANTMIVTQNNNALSQAIILGTIQVNANGTLTKAANPPFTFNSGAIYNHNRDAGTVVTAIWSVTSNCNIIGSTANAPAGTNQTFANFTWNSTGQAAGVSLNSTATVNGTLWIQSTNNQILRITGSAVNQTWTVNNYLQDNGILELSNQAGNSGILDVSGTFTQNGGTLTKSGNNALNQIRFSGATDVSPILNGVINSTNANALIFNANKTAPAKVILPVNQSFNATVELRVTTGTLDLGSTTSTVTANGPFNLQAGGIINMSNNTDNILDLKGSVTYVAGGTLLSGANNQFVKYTGAAQNVMPLTYQNLTIDVAGIKTMLGALTVNNNLLITGSATLYTNTFQITGNATGTFTMDVNTFLSLGNIGSATNVQFPLNYIAANIFINSNSTVTYQNNAAQTVSGVPVYGNLTIATGGVKTLTGGTAAAFISGNLTISAVAGTFDLGTTATSLDITGNTIVTGILTFGTTAKAVSLTGNLSGGGTINMNGVGLAHTLNLGGATNAITAFNTAAGSGSTVNYNRLGAQTAFGSLVYRNLTLSGSGAKTFGANTTVNNDLIVGGGSTFDMGTVATAFIVSGNASIDGSISYSITSNKSLSIAGNLSGLGSIDMSGVAGLTYSLNLSGATNSIGSLTTNALGTSTISYTSALAQTVFTSPNYRNLTISGGGNKSLQGSIVVNGALTLTSGQVILGSNDLTIANGATSSAGSTASMVITNGTGQMKKVFPAIGSAFTFPVGDISGSNDYSPTTITYTANSTIRTIGVKVTDTQHPNDLTVTDYISRYWSFTDDQAGTYTYNASFSYSAVAPTDLTGVYGNLKINRWDGSFWNQYNTTTGGAPVINTTAAVTEVTSPLNNSDFTGRVNVGTYTWNQSNLSGDFQVATNWTPARLSPQSTDILIFDNNGTTTATNVPAQTIGKLILQNNSIVTLEAAAAATLTISNSTGTDLTVNTGTILSIGTNVNLTMAAAATATIDGELSIATARTFTTNGVATITTVNGTISNTGTITSSLTGLVFTGSGIYNHTQNGGTVPTATWNVASNIYVTLGASATVNGFAQSFGNVTYTTAGANTLTLAQSPTILGTLTITGATGTFAIAANTVNLTGNLTGNGLFSMTTGTLNIGGDFTNSGAFTCGTGTVNYNGAAQQVKGTTYYNFTISGSNTKTMLSDIIITRTATFTAGTLDINGNTLNLNYATALGAGTITGSSSSNLSVTANATPAFTFPIISGGLQNFTINKTGATNTVTLGSNLDVTGAANFTAGAVILNGNTLNLNGTTSVVAGTITGSATSNIGINSTSNVAMILPNITGGLLNFNVNKTGTTNTVALGGALTLGGTITLTDGALVLNNFLLTLNGSLSQLAGSITGGGTSDITIGTPAAAAISVPTITNGVRNFILNRTAGITLTGDNTVTGTLTLTSGKILLGANNLIIANGATIAGGSVTAMVVTDGLGQLMRVIPTAGLPLAFTFPVGDITGSIDYSPTTLTFSANNTIRTIGVRVTDAQHPNDGTATDYISRYWSFTDNQAGVGTYTYTALFNHSAVAPADLVGANGNMRVDRWDGSLWTQYTSTWPSGTSIQAAGLTETSAPLNNSDFTGRVNGPTTYTWNQSNATASWIVPTNWTPSRISPQPDDILVFNSNGITTATNIPAQTIGRLVISGNTDASLASAGAIALTIGGASGTNLDIQNGSTLQLSSTGANRITLAFALPTQTVSIAGTLTIDANAAFNNTFDATNSTTSVTGSILNNGGGVTSSAANLNFRAGSTYTHAMNGGVLPTATWNTTSTINVTGTTATAVTGLNQTFGNLDFNCLSLTAFSTATLSGATIVQGDFSITGTSAAFRFTLQLAAQNFTVNGNTTVSTYGILNDNLAAGTNLFIGNVTVAANGQWINSNNPPFTFRGGITNNGTFTAGGTGAYTFNTNPQVIDGSQTVTISNFVTTGITVTNRNTASLTLGTLNGTGNFTNGDVGFNALLTLTGGAPNPILLGGTLDLNSNPNTVNYNGAAAQTIGAYNFYNLTSSSTGARTLVNGGTIGIAGAFTPFTNVYTTTGNTINFNGILAQNIPTFTYNNLTVSGGSTKTLVGNVTVPGVLNLNAAILELAAFNLTISNNAALAIVPGVVFGASNMISTNGAGYLVKNAASLQPIFPVGSGTYFSPFTLTSIAPAGGTVSVRAVTPFPLLNPSYIKKYWDIANSVARTSATATFQYDAAELNGASQSIAYSPNSGTTWQNPPISGTAGFGGNSFSITNHLQNIPLSVPSALTGWWTMGYRTFYSYQTGDWNTATTWTSDPSGTLQIGTSVPGYNDKVVILSGRTVSLSSNIVTQNLDITINAGGFLNQSASWFTNTLLALRGQGTFQLATANFPTVTTNTFVSTGGGTVEYNNIAGFTLPVAQTIYNNLTINMPVGIIGTQMNNLTLNGNLYVKQGVYRINDNASTNRREITIAGNVTVDANGEIAVGTGTTNQASIDTPPFKNYYDQYSHRVVINGDFTNNGIVRFTNLAFPVYNVRATNGFATVYFQGTTNNNLICNSQTDFYNIVLDKGTDQTYKLTVTPSAYTNFRLFGANYSGGDQTAPATASNPNIYKALWIRNGSLVLSGFTVIPSLTEGTGGGTPNADYFIPVNGALVLDNPNVIVLVTADDYNEVNAAYGFNPLVTGTGVVNGVLNNGSTQALSILGTVQVNDGFLSTRESAGFVTWNYASGQLVINGGVVDTKQIRSGGGGGGKASYLQSGGLFILRGRFQRTPTAFATPTDLSDYSLATLNTLRVYSTTDGNSAAFGLTDPGNVFSMTGGTIRMYDCIGGGAGAGAFNILSSSGNINVTNGLIDFIPTTGTGFGDLGAWPIATNAPFPNVTITRPSSGTSVQTNTALTVLKDLTINSGVLNANNLTLKIGGNFLVANGATYTPGTNWTIFNGTGAQTLTANTAAALAFKKLKIDKPAGTSLTLAGTQSTITVADTLMILKATLADGGKLLDFVTSATTTTSYLYSSGVHTGTGRIRLSDTDPQIIDGDGTAVFQNLDLNNTNAAAAPVSLANSITINGTLTLSQNKLFDIGSYSLILNSAASIANAGINRYIKTSGALGDFGIKRIFSAGSPTFTYPIGAISTSHAAPAYTPVTFTVTGVPTSWGSISVNPVGYEHPTTTTKNRSLTYFWRVQSNGIVLGPATISHGYTYSALDVVTGALITENGYVAARFNSITNAWTRGTTSDLDIVGKIIGQPGSGTFLNNVSFIDGDYTAGDDTPINPFGVSTTYYSRQSGAWNAFALGVYPTWSTDPVLKHTGIAAATFPGANDIVIIGNGNTVNCTANAFCASLQIQNGSTLDIYTYTGSVFSMVLNHPLGNGLIRLTTPVTAAPSTFTFPSGDFSDFNNNSGTTEFYDIDGATGPLYVLPANVTTYGNLILTPKGGDNLVLPNTNLTIKGDLTCGGDNPNAWIAMSWSTNINPYFSNLYLTIQKTVHITGNLYVNNGTLIYLDDIAPQHLIVDGNVTVAPAGNIRTWPPTGGYLNIAGAPQANTLSIGGNLYNNTNAGNLISLSNVSNVNGQTYYCDVTFFGSGSASITNTSGTPITTFNKVTINKGSSQATTLTCNIGGALNTLTDNWLTLLNGTFIYNRTGDLNISTITDFTIPSTAGLTINTPSNVFVANSAANNENLFLNGNLTLLNGNFYVGPNGNTANNADIEYSGGGASTISIQGGQLFVNGQIRRNLSSTVGVLSYTQSNGAVTINGNNQNPIRAKLEVVNAGSAFNMSNGTLTIVKGGGTTFGDLYIRPASSTVTGGTILFAHNISGSNQSYLLDANVPLNNLTITGRTAAVAANASVGLMTNPLVLKGSLTLTNANSILISNNRDISIKGNLNNSGTYTYGNNNTTFNGGVQSITGTSVSNFYDLTVSPVTSLTVNNSFTVNRNLTITSGNLALGALGASVKGDFVNNGSYTDNNAFGVIFNGTTQQTISGSGSFGRFELNNNTGAKLNSDVSLQNDFMMTLGILDINQYQLTLSQNSTLGGAPFSLTKMIVSDGVASSLGLRKFFNTIAAPTSFTFPVGVTGKYTPAIYTLTANSTVGSITVNPINNNHPAVTDALNVLKYYWEIETSGVSNLTGNLVLQYLPGDVQGVESDYVAAQLLIPGTYWSKASPGPLTDNVDEVTHQITFSIPAGTNTLTGDYTAGNDLALPNEVPTYQTNTNGNWTDNTIWDAVGSSPPCPAGGPNGFNVIINHVVATNSNYCFSYNTTINGTLHVISTTFGHNLGTISGGGTLLLESPNLPAGKYDSFFDCTGGGIIEYSGTGNYTIIASLYSSVPNLYFTGTGIRTLPNKDLTICNRLLINGPTLDNSVNNSKLTILGTMERPSGSFIAGTGANATVSFAGSAPQTVGGALGNFSGANSFNNLEINNTNGLSIGNGGLIEVTGLLKLTSGNINTSSTNSLSILSNSTTAVTPTGGSLTSYVSGPLLKRISSGSSFIYPLGSGIDKGHPFTLNNTAASQLDWTAEFITPTPNPTLVTAPLQATNTEESWTIKTTGAATGKVKVAWDASSALNPTMTLNGISDMRIAEFNAGSWVEQVSTTTGNATAGDVASTNNLNFSTTAKSYTTASVTTTIPRASFNPTGPICGNSGIPVKFTSFFAITLNYTLDYTFNGTPFTTTVSSLPFTLPTPTAGTYQLTGFKYNGGTVSGVVDGTPLITYATPTTAAAGLDQSWCGLSGTTLDGNDPTPFTGLWTKISGIGGTFISNTTFNTVFNGTLGNTYTLRWTISSGSCKSSDDVVIAFPVTPQKPSAFTSAPTPVCMGSIGKIYTVPSVPSTTYTWTYSGTDVTINGTGNSVTLDFGPAATSGTLGVTATSACGTSAARTVNITVLSLPTITLGANPSACFGNTSTSIDYTATTGSPNQYSIVYSAAAIAAGFANVTNAALPLSPIPIVVPAAASPAVYTANLTVRNLVAGCVSPSYPITITVNPLPTIALGSNPQVCRGVTLANLTYGAIVNSPNLYSINFDVTAEGVGFVDVAGIALPASPIPITAPIAPAPGTYNAILTVQNSTTGCISNNYNITTTIHPLPTSNVTGLATSSPICDGEVVQLNILLTGQPPFNFTVQDDHGHSWAVNNLNVASGSTYVYTIPANPIWIGPVAVKTTYIYTVTGLTDANGCAEATPTGSATVEVYKIPTTGPGYHIPNNFGL
jgi:hypothetical protein